jgi:hypothetical protein
MEKGGDRARRESRARIESARRDKAHPRSNTYVTTPTSGLCLHGMYDILISMLVLVSFQLSSSLFNIL